jgi:Domain of unknown function (DUF4259)
MGAWEATSFGNDTAMDWVAQLEDDGAAAVTRALTAAVEANEYLDASEAEEAVTASEVVAAGLGHPAAELPAAVKTWVQGNHGSSSPADAQLALQALDRVSGDNSELYELWVEDAEDPEWSASIAELRQRLERSIST